MALEGLRLLILKFQNALDSWKLTVTHLEMLLHCKRFQAAKDLVEDIIVGLSNFTFDTICHHR